MCTAVALLAGLYQIKTTTTALLPCLTFIILLHIAQFRFAFDLTAPTTFFLCLSLSLSLRLGLGLLCDYQYHTPSSSQIAS